LPAVAVHRAGRAGALLASAAATLALAGCGASDNDPGPGGVTVGEARALDEAAEMLEQQRLPAQATPAPAPSPDSEAPAPAAAD
jgi:hypothetical protein